MNGECTILLVEDRPDDAELIRYAFGKLGIPNPLTVVGDGDAAVDYLGGTRAYGDRLRHPLPALILLDLKLPRRSGLEVLRFLRRQDATRHTPVVVLTSSSQREDIRRAYDGGANSYLVKPVGRDSLIAMVRALELYWMNFNVADTR